MVRREKAPEAQGLSWSDNESLLASKRVASNAVAIQSLCFLLCLRALKMILFRMKLHCHNCARTLNT